MKLSSSYPREIDFQAIHGKKNLQIQHFQLIKEKST